MDYNEENPEILLKKLDNMFFDFDYSKIFAKIPGDALPSFLIHGYEVEGFIPNFFNNRNDGFFVSKFSNERRSISNQNEFLTFRSVLEKYKNIMNSENKNICDISILNKQHANKISKLLSNVFPLYPFPVEDPDYIKKTMDENIIYFGIFEDGILKAVSSAETYPKKGNAEMTDFAVLPELRGQGIANCLLKKMENYCKTELGINTMYTIARLSEPGINALFLKNNYHYSGTLINNTKIFQGIESMNIYYKKSE